MVRDHLLVPTRDVVVHKTVVRCQALGIMTAVPLQMIRGLVVQVFILLSKLNPSNHSDPMKLLSHNLLSPVPCSHTVPHPYK